MLCSSNLIVSILSDAIIFFSVSQYNERQSYSSGIAAVQSPRPHDGKGGGNVPACTHTSTTNSVSYNLQNDTQEDLHRGNPVCRVRSIWQDLGDDFGVIIYFTMIYISNRRRLSFIFINLGDGLCIFCRLGGNVFNRD